MTDKDLYEILGKDKDSNHYEVLGVDKEATVKEIKDAYYKIYWGLTELKKDKKITDEEYEHAIEKLTEIYDTLNDEQKREEYDESLKKAQQPNPSKKHRGTKVTAQEDAPKKTFSLGSFILGGLSVALIIALIIVSLKGCSNDKFNAFVPGTGQVSSGELTDGNYVDDSSETPGSTEDGDTSLDDKTEDEDRAPVMQPRDFGDITNQEEVLERAKAIVEQLEKNKCNIDLATGCAYTDEQVKNIILYMNGAYVPENEEDVYNMYFEFLNFVCVLGNSEHFINQVNYRGGETSFADKVAQNAQNPMSFDLATAATFGQGYGAEYARWLQEQYFKMLYTTNDDDYNKIWSEVWQSFADIMKGNGYKMNVENGEIIITEQSLLLPNNIGVANQINFWLLNFEAFRTNKVQVEFDVINENISAIPEEQHDTVSFDEMAAYINASCDSKVLDGIDFAVDDDGKTLYTTTTDERGFTWGMITQYNTKAQGLNNLYIKNHTK